MLNPMIELRDFLFKKEDPTRHPAIQQPRRRTLAGTNAHAFASQMRARAKRSSDETIELSNNPLTPIAEDGRSPSPVVVFNVQQQDEGDASGSPTLSSKRMKSRSLPSFSDFAKLAGFGKGGTPSTGTNRGNKKRGLLGVIGESGSDDEEEKKENDGDLEEGK